MTIFHFADLQQSIQNSVLNFQSLQLQYSCTAVQLYSCTSCTAVQLGAVQLAAASYGATPAQHEALDGNRRGVEGVLREYRNTALYYHPRDILCADAKGSS